MEPQEVLEPSQAVRAELGLSQGLSVAQLYAEMQALPLPGWLPHVSGSRRWPLHTGWLVLHTRTCTHSPFL